MLDFLPPDGHCSGKRPMGSTLLLCLQFCLAGRGHWLLVVRLHAHICCLVHQWEEDINACKMVPIFSPLTLDDHFPLQLRCGRHSHL